jgi:bifunctional DNA-binding transcriptional regulator/antitoxin component of YhaV-PrlF toxin-antitoxin module
MPTAIVSPEGQIIISAEWTSALDLKAGDRVSFNLNEAGLVVTPEAAAKPPILRRLHKDASLEEKIAFYNSPEFIQSFTDGVNAARADLKREIELRAIPPAQSA